ncbi:unnamed protein product, partial [Urochloa humidicola]
VELHNPSPSHHSLSSSFSLLFAQCSSKHPSPVSLCPAKNPSWASCLGMQDQLICRGCKRVLQYRRGSTGVCCPGCNTFTAANPSGPEMSELVCGGCFTMLMYNRGASNIRCPHCSRVNSTRSAANQIGHLSCGHCRTTLAYPPGASTVGCPTCRCVNPVRNNNSGGSARAVPSDARPQTVLVENPKTLDEKGKLVSNVAVGVTSWKR